MLCAAAAQPFDFALKLVNHKCLPTSLSLLAFIQHVLNLALRMSCSFATGASQVLLFHENAPSSPFAGGLRSTRRDLAAAFLLQGFPLRIDPDYANQGLQQSAVLQGGRLGCENMNVVLTSPF